MRHIEGLLAHALSTNYPEVQLIGSSAACTSRTDPILLGPASVASLPRLERDASTALRLTERVGEVPLQQQKLRQTERQRIGRSTSHAVLVPSWRLWQRKGKQRNS
jgi:hypothetical protein